ncbi:26s proteasome regulatory subunit n8 [Nannochloropsis gaditana]|uniref:26s proteasome regulatory subunit n8 n=1 Tax=Nannochloropsis gaditana TaxID=72520 RepID=W7U155_9STRA|nr:26s proteasome regulatory subunit n8 [Nannochloropsis gaditana]
MAPMGVEKDKKDGVGEDAPKNGDNKKPEEEATTIVTTANLAADELEVIVHPLVLLSTVDHYNRVAKDTRKRVVGVLLGTTWRGRIDITNSFAVPFEEDLKNPLVWYLDHNYLESMFYMFKKINAKERIVGFYSTGPKIKENDLQIDEVFRRFSSAPVFVIIDVRRRWRG